MGTRLERVPFLTIGKFNGEFEVTRKTLENIYNNFKEEIRDIPIFIGHSDFRSSRGVDAQKTNGWIDSILLENDILYFSGEIDSQLCDLIESGTLRGCSGEFYVKDIEKFKSGEETDNRFLGGMAILGSDIPAVDIARVTNKNLVKRLKKRFVPDDYYLNEGVYLAEDESARVMFEAKLKKFLSLAEGKDKGEFMQESLKDPVEDALSNEQQLNHMVESISDRICGEVSNSLEKIINAFKTKLEKTDNKEEDSNNADASVAAQLAYIDKLTSRIQNFNDNFAMLNVRKTGGGAVNNYITSCEDLISNIKLHQRKHGIASFGEAESEFTKKNAHRIKIKIEEEKE
ncbi:hypothetical protein [Borrelia sp. P9F1]|uniref:hypothetical protein n=1 Tax=Borrelia sp. P9F1 TaxID=3058374 RepID=UPI002648C31E|nr:hypothetical protein [Borrelia sp. P9F1]WKC58573.1 hypothetical protein QYZ68_05070 [Borrelia sp. P9F1]